MKKQIVLISLAVLALSTRATVKPIYDGENMWKLVERIGIEADAIENKVCNMPLDERCYKEIGQTDIDPDGFTITAPGVYCLAENVTVPAGTSALPITGITIESDCVVLDLKGRSIDGQDLNYNVGIEIDGSVAGLSGKPANVVVKNGVVKRTDYEGVSVIGVTGPVKLSNLRVTEVYRDPNVSIWQSTGVLVEHCEASKSDDSDGFQISNSFFCVFRDCIARENEYDGFRCGNSSNCCFINCKALGNWRGFYTSGSTNNVFRNCIAVDNDYMGFYVRSQDDCVFEQCAAIASYWGFHVLFSDNNMFRRCIACGNDDNGFFIDLNSSNNQILNCSAVGNGVDGIDNDSNTSKIFANAANDNTNDDYAGVSLTKTTPTASNKYWTNVERI